MYKVEKILRLTWTELPQKFKDQIRDRHDFHNDISLEHWSELGDPTEMTLDMIDEYYLAQMQNNNYSGTRPEFIEKYGLEFDVWLMENFGHILPEVDNILIDICW